MTRLEVMLFLVVAAVAGVALAFASTSSPTGTTATDLTMPPQNETVRTVTVDAKIDGRGAAWWARRARQNHRNADARGLTIRRLKRTLAASPTVGEALGLAGVAYGNGDEIRHKAFCESTNDPHAHNKSGASGLLQFKPSTWASTPYRSFSIWSPYASALAAGWMIDNGRRSEWTCR